MTEPTQIDKTSANPSHPLEPSGLIVLGLAGMLFVLDGCTSGLEHVDRRTQWLVDQYVERSGADEETGKMVLRDADSLMRDPTMNRSIVTAYTPQTVNPPRDRFRFEEDRSGKTLSELLKSYTDLPEDVPRYDLQQALGIAVGSSREYITAKEELFLAALRLLNERHLFGPRFFDDVSANVDVLGEEGDPDIALRLTNEFRITQNLRSGGSLSARALVSATEQLRETIADSTSQSASLILSADLPLLRGAGTVAEESLISGEREMVYATRTFERFRRQFLFNIATDYFDLVLAAGRIENAEQVLTSRQALVNETEALVQAGRKAEFDVNDARQRLLQSQNSLASARDAFVVSLERFRSRLGLPPDSPFRIKEEVALEIPVPEFDMEASVRRGLTYRLDLQNTRDQVDDSRRAVLNARNDLLPELNLSASMTTMTESSLTRAGLQFDFDDSDFRAGVTFGLPLDRETERIGVRRSIINLERARRRLQDDEDNVALEIRRAIRDIQLARFSLALQEESLRTIEQRKEFSELRPDQATTRSQIDIDDDYQSALESRDSAKRDLRVALLRYLVATGQFRVAPDGKILLAPSLEQMPQTTETAIQAAEEEGNITADSEADEKSDSVSKP